MSAVARPRATTSTGDHGPGSLGIDIGGTHVKIVAVDGIGTVTEFPLQRTPTVPSAQAADAVAAIAYDALREAERDGHRIEAVGIAVPGAVDELAGVVHDASNLGWSEVALAGPVRRAVPLPVTIRHDVRAGACAEAQSDIDCRTGNLVYVPIGTGIAAGLVIDGAVFAGDHWTAGEIGHLAMDPAGESCACGRRGCLETVASARAIARRYSAAVTGRGERAAPAQPVPSAADVFRAMRAGDRDAAAVVDAAVQALAEALSMVHAVVGIDRIVMGGGLSRAGDDLMRPLRAALRDRAGGSSVELRPAVWGDRSSAVGAALLAGALLRPAHHRDLRCGVGC